MPPRMEFNADLAGNVLTLRPARPAGDSAGWSSSDFLPPDHERAELMAKLFRPIADNPTTETPPAPWDASTLELIGGFQTHRERLPVEPFDLKPGGGVRVIDPALFYRTLDADIAHGLTGPRGRFGGLADDLKCLKATWQRATQANFAAHDPLRTVLGRGRAKSLPRVPSKGRVES